MNMKRMAAASLAALMLLTAGCARSDTGSASTAEGSGSGSAYGSGVSAEDAPTLAQIYAANTLERYLADGIEPSITTCLREDDAEVYTETNTLLTAYDDDTLGTVVRYRTDGSAFRFYFNRDGAEYSASEDEDENVTVTALTDVQDDLDEDETYGEYIFEKNSYGAYNKKETVISCTDCGDTYHIVTDISALSFTDSAGRSYTYTTQTYDVEKETLRILDTLRTYFFVESDGTSKQMTFFRCLTYGTNKLELPEFMTDTVLADDWSRTFTLVSEDTTEEIAVPSDIETLVQTADGYEVYTSGDDADVYTEDAEEDGALPDRRLYIREVDEDETTG